MMDEFCRDMESYKTIQDAIHRNNPEGYVSCQENGLPYEPRTYQDVFKRCARRARIPDANFHALRHTFATRALEHGTDVVTLSRILGHANPSITLDKYGHAQEEQKKRSINQMGDIYQHTTEQRLAAQEAEIAAPKLSWVVGMVTASEKSAADPKLHQNASAKKRNCITPGISCQKVGKTADFARNQRFSGCGGRTSTCDLRVMRAISKNLGA